MQEKAAIIILDGWGIGRKDHSDAVWQANTPFTDTLTHKYSHTTLRTDGENVGLPEGQMGNSEVGHMNIGAGRIVWQMLVRINKAFQSGDFKENVVWADIMQKAKARGALHLMGLVSDGGVHSHINHLKALCVNAQAYGIPKIYVHAFLDGRDTDPKGGKDYIQELEAAVDGTRTKVSTIVGRYYAMDRDKRWERVSKAWNLLVKGKGNFYPSSAEAIENFYQQGITDEFMEPIRLLEGTEGLIENEDVVLCFNYRTDRGRQITEALSQKDFADAGMHKLSLEYFTMTEYDATFHVSGVLFENQNLKLTLGEVLSLHGKSQLRAAETEKYPHVSFFFSGGREAIFEGENRLLVNSPKVATYDLQPAMSAPELTQNVKEYVQKQQPDFVCLNFANPDMVGHTGVFKAIVQAVETVDACLNEIASTLLELGYHILVIADHGNADFAINEDGSPNTAHTTNPVPCWLVSNNLKPVLHSGILADVAPTILKIMNLPQPNEMSGKALF